MQLEDWFVKIRVFFPTLLVLYNEQQVYELYLAMNNAFIRLFRKEMIQESFGISGGGAAAVVCSCRRYEHEKDEVWVSVVSVWSL